VTAYVHDDYAELATSRLACIITNWSRISMSFPEWVLPFWSTCWREA
jgi:hypothetical protein